MPDRLDEIAPERRTAIGERAAARAPRLPFAHLNLRWNPFGEADFDERARMAVPRVRPPEPGEKVQVIGEAGHGKSSTLRWLTTVLDGATYHYVPPTGPAPRDLLQGAGPLLIDEAQRLPPRLLRRLFESERTVVAGTHDDLQPHAPRPLRTERLVDCPEALLQEVIERRLEWARRAPGPIPKPSAQLLRRLLELHRGAIRSIEAELYDRYQALEGGIDVEL